MSLDYAPDLSRFTPGVLTAVSDFVPTVTGSYKVSAPPYLEGYTTPAATTDIIGSAIVKNKAGTALLYAGSTTKLWQANGVSGWTDRSAKAYSGSSTGVWDFLQFGDSTLAANGVDTLQSASGGVFADVLTAPAGKILIGHENAVIILNTAADRASWARCDTGDATNWTPTAANDADAGTLYDGIGGPLTAGTTWGATALAFKNNAMYGGIFVGDIDQKVRWQTIARGVGCVAPRAHIATELGIIFVSDRDVLLFDGTKPRSIADKLRKTFFQSMSNKAQIFLTHDEIERNVYIWIPVSGSTYPLAAAVYNYKTGKWGLLNTISNNTDAANSYARCPVVNANYTDYTAVGGMATNTDLQSNVVWVKDTTTGKLVNFALSAAAARKVAPSMQLWVGQKDRDSTLTGARIVTETPVSSLYPPATFGGISYDTGLTAATSSVWTGAVASNTDVNANQTNRFHRMDIGWGTGGSGVTEIIDIVPRYAAPAGSK